MNRPPVRHAELEQYVSANPESDFESRGSQAAAGAAEAQQSIHANVESDLQGQRPQAQPSKIPCMHAADLPYEAFVTDFMEPNLPVMIQVFAKKDM